MGVTPRPIRLHIEQLVLHGFDPLDRHAIGDAVRNELREVLRDQSTADVATISIPRLRAGTVPASAHAGEGIGTAVGRAVDGALRR
ncbi:MAG: hypothetical protein JWO97_1572 [Acidobacteria bacterium]|nr:hypothetical protein [Acidobacteriota bacterium]